MNILNLLQGAAGTALLDNVAGRLGIENKQARTAIAIGVPILIAALQRNAKKPEAADGILGAINKKHDGGILDNLSSFLGGSQEEKDDDGLKILGHIFGSKEEDVANNISKQSGIPTAKVIGMLSMLAPVVMGMVGKNAKDQNADASGLSGVVSNLLGGLTDEQPSAMGFIEDLLDGNSDKHEGSGQDMVSNLMKSLF